MKKFLFALLALCMSISANAQIYDSNNVHYYIKAGTSIGNASISIYVYDGNKAYKRFGGSRRQVMELMNKYNMTEYVKKHPEDILSYDAENSTSSRTVYKFARTRFAGFVGNSFNAIREPDGYWVYSSVANDKSEYISTVVSPSGDTEKYYYVEVSERDIKNYSPSVNKSYLHE